MLATLAENGRFGAVAIGDTPEEAERLMDQLTCIADEEAQMAVNPRLPKAIDQIEYCGSKATMAAVASWTLAAP